MAALYLTFKLRVKVVNYEIQTCRLSNRSYSLTANKTRSSITIFAAFSGSPACCIPSNGDGYFI